MSHSSQYSPFSSQYCIQGLWFHLPWKPNFRKIKKKKKISKISNLYILATGFTVQNGLTFLKSLNNIKVNGNFFIGSVDIA